MVMLNSLRLKLRLKYLPPTPTEDPDDQNAFGYTPVDVETPDVVASIGNAFLEAQAAVRYVH